MKQRTIYYTVIPGIFLWRFFLFITCISLILFSQMKQRTSLLVGRQFHPHIFKTINTPKAHASTKAVTVMDDLDVGTIYQQGRWKEALLMLQVKDMSVERWTYIYMLQGCIERTALSEGKRIHAHMNQRGEFMSDTFLSSTLLNMYIKCGSVVDARRIFDQMAERERDVCSWTVMIAAYSRHWLSSTN